MNRLAPAHSLSYPALAAGLTLTLTLMLTQPALAALNNPVTVSLVAPGGDVSGSPPFTLSQSVDPLVGIGVGDGSDIGGYLLAGEQIRFVDNSIRLHVAAGWQDGSTGALSTGILGAGAEPARYEFSGLSIAGQTIVGFTLYAFDGYASSGFSGVLSGTSASLVSPSQLSFRLDDLRFIDRGNGSSNAFGEFRIDLLSQPVPEPAGWALLMAGLAGALVVANTPLVRRARNGARDQVT